MKENAFRECYCINGVVCIVDIFIDGKKFNTHIWANQTTTTPSIEKKA